MVDCEWWIWGCGSRIVSSGLWLVDGELILWIVDGRWGIGDGGCCVVDGVG